MDDNPERLVKKIIDKLDEELGDIDTDDYIKQWHLLDGSSDKH
jgi:hypothetical protein